MANYWFKPKKYGYGATPVTWQGWVVTMVCALVPGLSYAALAVLSPSPVPAYQIGLLVAVVVADVVVLTSIAKTKTEGGWRWRWGNR